MEWSEKWTKCVDVMKKDDNKLKITLKHKSGFFSFFRGVPSRVIIDPNCHFINVSVCSDIALSDALSVFHF